MIRRPRLGLPPPGPRGLPPTPRRCHRLRTGRMSPLFPPPPRGTRAPAERGSPGAACQLPSRPTLPWARPGAWQAGSTPTIGAKPGNWSKGREGPDQATDGAGCPQGCQGRAAGRGQCQSWQGQSSSHGSVMGALTHASHPVPAGPLAPGRLQLWHTGTLAGPTLPSLVLIWSSCCPPFQTQAPFQGGVLH